MKAIHLTLVFILFFISNLSYSQGSTCANAEPFCTSNGATFPASTSTTAESGPNYGCLGSQPNPAWYYLQISQAGNLDITLSNSGGYDIDFIAWGPYASIGTMCYPNNSGVDCSFSTDATEYLNLTNTQVGEYYLVLITNFSGSSTNISANQTGGGGATDCSIVNPCSMTFIDANLTACSGGTFDITGQVQFADPPTTGTLTVTNCSGDQQVFTAPFTSPINYAINGINADATAGCSVTAVFSADPACTITSTTFTEPICTCFMSFFSANVSACDGFLNTYSVGGDLEFTNAPTTGQLIVEVDNGVTTYNVTVNAPFTSPYTWDIPGIPADGLGITVTAYFSADPTCDFVINGLTAPAACLCSANAGTFNGNLTGISPNDYVLCFGDQIDLTSNNDFTSPQDLSPINDQFGNPITYDPGIGWLAYTCPPTVFPTNPLWIPDPGNPGFSMAADPCLIGYILDGGTLTDINTNGAPPNFGTPYTNNTIYYVPITTYSNQDGFYAVSINGGPWCYDMGTPFAVQYLPEIIASSVEDCNAGTATFTISGGLPEVDGSNFTASNLQPGTASFGNSTTGNGGTIVINGLQDGDMYSFDIIDVNGCPQTFSGGPFVAAPTANAGNDDTNCSFSYGLNAVPSFGTGTWTGAGVTFSNSNSPTTTATVTSAGSYTMTWTEDNGNGCISTDDVIVQFSNLSYVDAVVQSTCGNADGTITLTASNGITAYQYSIDNGATFQASGSFTGLLANTYNIVVQDNIGCQVTGTVSVIDQGGPVINSVIAVDPLCNGGCDGSISINATGATLFSIDNGATFQGTNAFANLCIGTYPIVVENAIGCQANSSIDIIQPPTLSYTTTNTDLLCANDCIGTIDVNATGGAGVLQYSSDNGVTFSLNNVLSNLCAGNFDVVVQDANECQVTTVETITEPAPLSVLLDSISPLCSSSCDGSINSIPSGGDGNYNYAWSNGMFLPFISGLCTGQYDLNIVDGNGCVFDTSITLVGPLSVTITNVITTDVTCFNDCDGTLEIVALNATQYSIDGTAFQVSPIFTGLCSNLNMTVYAQDANTCNDNAPAIVDSPSQLGATATSISPICIDGSSLLSGSAGGGTSPYAYSWEDNTGVIFTTQNGNVSPVTTTSYTLTVTDFNLCTANTSTIVQVLDSLDLTVFGNSPVCEGATSNLSAIASGGDGLNASDYTYTWDNGLGVGQTQTVNPTQTTTYTVTVTDGCETPPISAQVAVIVNTVPNVSFTGDTLYGCAPVITNFTEINVPSNATCLWNFGDGNISQDCDATNIFTEPGCWDVTLTITTFEGCVGVFPIPNYVCVYDYPTAEFAFAPIATTVMNPLISFVNQSSDAESYNWIFDVGGVEDMSTEENPTYEFPGSNPGTYEVCLEAVSVNQCTDTVCHDVTIDEEFIVYVPNAFTPDGDLINNIFIPVVKGVDPFKYSFMVFNRWGELIFESSHPTIGWDGYYKNLLSQTDVYVWRLSCVATSTNQKHEYIGHVTLLK